MSLTAPTHQTSPHEIRDLLAVVERDLHDSDRSRSVVAMTASPDEQGSHGMSRSTIRPKRATRRTATRADAARLDRLIEEARGGRHRRDLRMSEYQYYEFQAIDRPLSDGDMRNLRAFSTRARITRTLFVNEYQWGSFKGDEDAWMAKYFDAFLYYANWNTRIIKLRVPAGVIAAATARRYCRPGALELRKTATHLIFTFASDDDSGADDEVPEATLSSFAPLRQDLARGDIRALYLGWLLSVQAGERDDNEREPPVPADLSDLSASLANLAERERRVEKDLAAAEARRVADEARARERHLDGIAPRRPQLWTQVEKLVATTKPASYAEALELLLDLRDLSARQTGSDDFQARLATLKRTHAAKPAFPSRLRRAGL